MFVMNVSTVVLSVFWVTERTVCPRMSRPIYLFHAVQMTDGGGRTTYTIRSACRMGGFGPVRTRPHRKKNRFLPDNGGPRRVKVDTSSHHTYHTTVHGRVEETDTKGSTWISKDVRWITRTQGICWRGSVTRPVEKAVVVEDPRLWKATVHTQWWSPWWSSPSRGSSCSETSWTREGDFNRRVHIRQHISLFYFPLDKCSSYVHHGCVHFQFSRHTRRMNHRLYYEQKSIFL